MSWNISFTADTKAEAQEKLEKEVVAHGRHLPDTVKASVASAISALPECEDSTISVSTYGHFHHPEYGHRGTSNMSVAVANHFKEVADPPSEA